ncbi:RNA-binding protein [Candidatus Woesearchaeota archaeon CG_4_10_14_0_2_um_filter_33_10]|nr:MAG: RNA-binding protein [Candidatus Woesearchaeota archaeon CG10_big_fil_rev_8_21_14_0_10_33_12]PIZ53372.1 MAG: RNA-binding protein [Candidatus Woesearchaeota archaeon CG_4_10_14_0_2_um_filter_33_10]
MHKMLNNKKLKEKAKTLEPVIRIGKNGLTESTIKEIKKQLNKKKLIKVKLLRAFISDKNKKEVAKEIAEKTSSNLIYMVGFVIVLYKD